MTARFELGVAFLGDLDAREAVAIARDLDRDAGLSRLWACDDRFLRDPWVQLGALAAATSRISLGVCVTDAFVRHPALTAVAAATLDELSGGRAILGLGAGSTGFHAMGIDASAPAVATAECIELCRRLWRESPRLTYEGRRVRFIDDHLDFRPARQVPIYVAGRGPRMLAVGARLAETVLIGNFVRGKGLEYALATIRDAAAQRSAELPPLRRASWLYFSVGPDAEAARRAAARGLALSLPASHQLFMDVGYAIEPELAAYLKGVRHNLRRDEVDRLVDRLPDELVEDFTVAGDAAACAAKLRALAETGIEEAALLPFVPAGSSFRDVVDELVAGVAPAVMGSTRSA